jgi:hypothetical protein
MSILFVLELGQFSQYSNFAMGQMILGLVPGEGTGFCPFPNCPDLLQWSPNLIFNAYWPQHEAGHSPPSTAKVQNEWSYTSIPTDTLWWHVQWQRCPYLLLHFFNLSDKHLPKPIFKPSAWCQITWNRCSGIKLFCLMYNKLLIVGIYCLFTLVTMGSILLSYWRGFVNAYKALIQTKKHNLLHCIYKSHTMYIKCLDSVKLIFWPVFILRLLDS